jgi:hypothetical protein
MSGNIDAETLKQIHRMCEIILGDTFGNKELDSLAFSVGHHPDVLNAFNKTTELPEDYCLYRKDGSQNF